MDPFTSQSPYVSLLLLLVTTILYVTWKTRLQSRPVTPPSPIGLPIIGHLHLLLTEMPHHAFTRLSNQLGPIIYLQLGRVPTVLVSSSHLARQVLLTHDLIFANRPQTISAQYVTFNHSDITFSPCGPYWRQARKISSTELFSPKQIHSFGLVRDEEVTRLLTTLSTQSGTELDMSKVFWGLVSDILCRAAFGRRFTTEVEQGNGEGQKCNLVGVLSETQELFSGFGIAEYFPKWGWVNSVSGYKKRLMKNMEDLRVVCQDIIEEHLMRKEKVSDDKEDFVDVLLRAQRREDLEVPITDDNLKAILVDILIGGTDTSSATLEWAMTELSRHPRVMNKAQAEVRKVSFRRGRVEEIDLQHLHYLKAVIKETMRLHPPIPLLIPREPLQKCVLGGYQIPAKTRVLINTYAIGRDPQLWKNPLDFNPERFLDDDIDFKDHDFRFMPFGGGRRACPGYNFGLAVIELALARLLYYFDWALPPGVGPDDVCISEEFGLAVRKKSALVLVPIANKDRRVDRE